MFKGKLGLWIILLVVCILAQFLIVNIPVWMHTDSIFMSFDIDSDNEMLQCLVDKKIDKMVVKSSDSENDIIITDQKIATLNGYTKYSDYIWSPMVMYASGVYNNNEGLIGVPKTDNCYKIDFLSVLTAMENGDDWQSLGIHKDVANGPVILYIPNEQCHYFDDVVELFYLTLNKGSVPNEQEREALKERVDSLISKCHKVSDISQAVYDEYDEETKEHKVFIGPEYLYKRGKSYSMDYGGNNHSSFRPIYFMNTVYLKADVYTRNVENEDFDIGLKFVTSMKNNTDWFKATGWRVRSYTYDLTESSNVYHKDP